jgi:hypothetical protein
MIKALEGRSTHNVGCAPTPFIARSPRSLLLAFPRRSYVLDNEEKAFRFPLFNINEWLTAARRGSTAAAGQRTVKTAYCEIIDKSRQK